MLELSVQTRFTWLVEVAVPIKFDGADGIGDAVGEGDGVGVAVGIGVGVGVGAASVVTIAVLEKAELPTEL